MNSRPFRSHGNGTFKRADFAALGKNVIFEKGVLVFHPGTIRIEDNVYIGHSTILKGYHQNTLKIGSGTWIGQQCFLHSAGGLRIGRNVGIGPAVRILTSSHSAEPRGIPILQTPLIFRAVVIEDDGDIGTGAIILPGVSIGRGALIGAGSVVTRDIPAYSVAAGVPARVKRKRT